MGKVKTSTSTFSIKNSKRHNGPTNLPNSQRQQRGVYLPIGYESHPRRSLPRSFQQTSDGSSTGAILVLVTRAQTNPTLVNPFHRTNTFSSRTQMTAWLATTSPGEAQGFARLVLCLALSFPFSVITFSSSFELAVLLQLLLDALSLCQPLVTIGLGLSLLVRVVSILVSNINILPTRHHLQDRCLRSNDWLTFAPCRNPSRRGYVHTFLPVWSVFYHLLKDATPRFCRVPTRRHFSPNTGLSNQLTSQPFQLLRSCPIISLINEAPCSRPLQHGHCNTSLSMCLS